MNKDVYNTLVGYASINGTINLTLEELLSLSPVVRCRECIYSKKNGYLCCKKVKLRRVEKVYPGYYCRSGKRKE